jgi:predicted transcriptional regulator YdeE
MERIEIPAEVYFKSKDGKKFRVQEDCERWEAAYSKWTNQAVYREFENEEGQLCYAFWLESEEDLEDVLWFFDTKMHSCTRGSGFVKDLYPQWIVAYPYYDEYNADYSVSSIEDFKDALYETKQAVEDTLSEVIKLIWEKAR